MIILGIDPGVALLGYAILKTRGSNLEIIDYGCIKTSSQKIFSQRLLQIYQELKLIINKYQPQQVAIEHIYFAKNVKTAIKVSEARGVALLVAAENQSEILEYTPLQIKQAITGYGRAPKQQIQKMVKAILGLEKVPQPDDVADAMAVAITCWQTKNFDL
jgi:crossover junction endodeoxyribonuclease RuvC